jgi:hypothetical protein
MKLLLPVISAFAAASAAEGWATIMMHTCQKDLSYFPDHPEATLAFKTTPGVAFADALFDEAVHRIKLWCPALTKDEIINDVMAGIPTALARADKSFNSTNAKYSACVAADSSVRPNLVLPIKYKETDSGAIDLPTSCNRQSWVSGKGCTVKVDLTPTAAMKITVTPCAGSHVPSFKMECVGEGCKSMLLPCDEDSDCKGAETCDSLFDVFESEMLAGERAQSMKDLFRDLSYGLNDMTFYNNVTDTSCIAKPGGFGWFAFKSLIGQMKAVMGMTSGNLGDNIPADLKVCSAKAMKAHLVQHETVVQDDTKCMYNIFQSNRYGVTKEEWQAEMNMKTCEDARYEIQFERETHNCFGPLHIEACQGLSIADCDLGCTQIYAPYVAKADMLKADTPSAITYADTLTPLAPMQTGSQRLFSNRCDGSIQIGGNGVFVGMAKLPFPYMMKRMTLWVKELMACRTLKPTDEQFIKFYQMWTPQALQRWLQDSSDTFDAGRNPAEKVMNDAPLTADKVTEQGVQWKLVTELANMPTTCSWASMATGKCSFQWDLTELTKNLPAQYRGLTVRFELAQCADEGKMPSFYIDCIGNACGYLTEPLRFKAGTDAEPCATNNDCAQGFSCTQLDGVIDGQAVFYDRDCCDPLSSTSCSGGRMCEPVQESGNVCSDEDTSSCSDDEFCNNRICTANCKNKCALKGSELFPTAVGLNFFRNLDNKPNSDPVGGAPAGLCMISPMPEGGQEMDMGKVMYQDGKTPPSYVEGSAPVITQSLFLRWTDWGAPANTGAGGTPPAPGDRMPPPPIIEDASTASRSVVASTCMLAVVVALLR